jgi:hypothetical protein
MAQRTYGPLRAVGIQIGSTSGLQWTRFDRIPSGNLT